MKRILLGLTIALAIVSCKKKTTTQTPDGPEQWIVGYWEMTDLEVSGSVDVGGNAVPLTGDGSNFVGGYQLNSDKTASYDFSCDLEIVIPVMGTFPIPFAQKGSGTWALKNSNKLLVVTNTTSGQVSEFPIKVITENIMILEQDSTFNMGGVSGTLNYEVTLEK